jgi:adenosylcobinamide-GDP ribazoletransferase
MPGSPIPAAEVRGLAAAVAFLTRVPVGRFVELDAADVARGGALFPLVGAGIGTVIGGIAQGLSQPLTAPLAAVLGLAAGAVLTGVLHLDALADTADALGATTRERALEIMRDHSIGAYGGVALVLDLGAKVAALAALADRHDALRFAVCAAAAARVVPVLLSATLPYARPGEGTGRALASTGWLRCAIAVLIAVALCVLLHAVLLLAAVAVVSVVAFAAARRWLGGVTGDVLGAAAELAELAALVVAVAVT